MQQCIFFLLVGTIWMASGKLGFRNCDHMGVLLYEDLGCKPYFQDGSICPTSFSCTSFKSNNNTCLFRGKNYKANQEIDGELLAENCFTDCKCVDPAGFNKYKCNIMNCTEWVQDYNTTKCYKQYHVDQCCSFGTACPNGTAVYECPFEGEIYREGEIFMPANSCTKCSCRKGFRGVVEAPYCKRSLCATQVVDYEELENYCAPLYMPMKNDTSMCCPDDWVCSSGNSTIAKLTASENPQIDLFCYFGPTMVKYGEGFTTPFFHYGAEMNVTCECTMPPLLTCKPV